MLIRYTQLPLPKDLKVEDDGWLRGTGGELIVWIPPTMRAQELQSRARLNIRHTGSPSAVIDFGDFNGERWTEILSPATSLQALV